MDSKYEQTPSSPAVPMPLIEVAQSLNHEYASDMTTSAQRTGKRAFGRVFDTAHLNHGVQGGVRPEAAGQDVLQVECDEGLVDEDDLINLKMLSYRRADGSRQHKKIPSPIVG